jgi:hypothetical protein
MFNYGAKVTSLITRYRECEGQALA